MSANGADVKNNVFLCEGFTAKGEVRLIAASIGNILDLGGAHLENPGSAALIADRMNVKGDVHLSEGFTAKGEVQYCNRAACRGCALKPQCTANTHRRVGRWTEEAVLERMEARLAARPEILKQRREIAEHPFGSIKQWMNQGTFLLRGLEKVRAEFSLTRRWPTISSAW